MAAPLIYHEKALDRGMASSAEFNALIMDILKDMTMLSDSIDENEDMLNKAIDMIRHENDALLSRILQLEYNLQDVSNSMTSLKSGLPVKTLRALVSEPAETPSFTNFSVLDMYNSGMPSTFKVSDKFRIEDTPIPDLTVSVKEVYTSSAYNSNIFNTPIFEYNETTTPNIYNMFDGDQGTFFTRSAASQNATDTDSLYVMMTIAVPLSSVNNLNANCLKITPIPKYTLDIMSIEYKDANNGTWTLIPTFPTSNGVPTPIQNIPSTLMTFPTVELTELRIVFRQPKKLKQSNPNGTLYSEFFYGFQEFALQHITIATGTISFVSKFTVDTANTFFNIVLDPEIITDNYLKQTISAKFGLYRGFSKGSVYNPINFNEEIKTDNNTLYVETTLTTQGSEIPVIKGVKLKCQVKTNL